MSVPMRVDAQLTPEQDATGATSSTLIGLGINGAQ